MIFSVGTTAPIVSFNYSVFPGNSRSFQSFANLGHPGQVIQPGSKDATDLGQTTTV